MNTSGMIPLLLLFSCSNGLWGQAPNSYVQSHKEVELQYGVVAPELYKQLSDIEKIKYKLRYTERTLYREINGQSQQLEIVIDSTNTEESWMNLAKRFRYTDEGIDILEKDGKLLQHTAYTAEQQNDRLEIKQQIAEHGYHPGLVDFPTFDDNVRQALMAGGTQVEDVSPSVVKLKMSANYTVTVDNKFLTITDEWTDAEGIKNTELKAYEPYGNDLGFLLVMRKLERLRYSVNGPCITEVKLNYYTNYTIKDEAHLMEKAAHRWMSVEVYPNPNTGVFQVNVTGPSSMVIQRLELVHLISGVVDILSTENQRTVWVDKPQLPSGNYALRVFTSTQTLTTNFYKQ